MAASVALSSGDFLGRETLLARFEIRGRMKAAVYRRYGPPNVLAVEDVPKPAPRAGEVLVRVRASTVCAADWRLRKADPSFARLYMGLTRPKRFNILGMDFSGVVEALGDGVDRLAPGDPVFGLSRTFRCHADYVCVPQDHAIAVKPSNASFEQAAAIMFGGMTALHFLRKANVGPDQKVLVYGASGSVGTAAVQLAKYFGAHVTGVCSAANLDLVRSIGADDVIDYAKQDFWTAGRIYDVVFETVRKVQLKSLDAIKRGGVYLGAAGPLLPALHAIRSMRSGVRIVAGGSYGTPEDAAFFKELVESGVFQPVIDRRYALSEIVDAHRYVETGRKKGNVVVVMPESQA